MAQWKFEGDEILVALDDTPDIFLPFSCRFEIIEKLINIITSEEKVKIKISNGYTNPSIIIDRCKLAENSIVDTLTNYGVSVSNDPEVRLLVREILIDTERDAKIIFFHDKLGFVTIGDKEYYLANRLYSLEKTPLTKSRYVSPEMTPKGTLEEYRIFLTKEVCKFPKLALAFALGVTAPVAHILKKHGVFYEGLIWCFSGPSSSGKTTNLRNLLSIVGSPQFLLSNLNATANALSAQISAQAGFTFAADEATKSKLDFNELIYSLASGKDKRRCNGDGSLKDPINFSGAVFFTSEQSILDKCDSQGGQEARVVDFELDWFDGDSKKAERFLHFFNSHYGVAIDKLAPMLLDTKIQLQIVKMYSKAIDRLSKSVETKDGIDTRVVQRLAIILVSCWLLQKAIRVDFHIDDIEKLLLDVFAEKQSRLTRTAPHEMLIQLFVEDFLQNRDEYAMEDNIRKGTRHHTYAHSKSQRGSVGKFRGKDCLWIPVNIFNEILANQSTYGANTAKKRLHEAGYLEKFDTSYYNWHNFGSTSSKAYCVYLPTLTSEDNANGDTDTVEAVKIEPTKKMIAGFVGLTAQEIALLINEELATRLNLTPRKHLYLHLWASQDALILSTKPSEKAIELSFEKIGASFVSFNDDIKSALKAANVSVKSAERVLFTDITISGKAPTAMICVSNPYGQHYEPIDKEAPFNLSSFLPNKTIRKNRSLLEDK